MLIREGSAVFKTVFRVLLTLIVAGALVWFFAPRLFNDAANSLISSADASASKVQGLAQYMPPDANQATNNKGDLQVNLSGLSPNTSYELTLDESQCGSDTRDLGAVNSDGNGNFYIELPLATLDTNQTWFVDVHQQGVLGTSVACGQLQTNLNSSAQAIDATQAGPNVFGPQQSGQNAQGTTSTPTSGTKPNGLPNTGVNPGNGQQYDNNQYPRKY